MRAAVASHELCVKKVFMPKYSLLIFQGSFQLYNGPFPQATTTNVCVASVLIPEDALMVFPWIFGALAKMPLLTCIFLRLGKSPGEI